MSTEVTTIKPRKATFKVVKGEGKNRVYRAVNKRAHTVVRKAGKRELITREQLLNFRNKGSYKFYQWNTDGTLSYIR